MVVLGGAFFVGYSKIRHRKNKIYLNNSIMIGDKLIKSTPKYYFIGKTSGYVFFFNEANYTTDVFPMNTVSKLTLIER
jgi:hypothetical protein